jgi:hypothetical protein
MQTPWTSQQNRTEQNPMPDANRDAAVNTPEQKEPTNAEKPASGGLPVLDKKTEDKLLKLQSVLLKKYNPVLHFYASFVLPDDPRFEDEALKCRGLLQTTQSFRGTRWEPLFPKNASQKLEPEAEMLQQLSIPKSLPRQAKAQFRRAAKVHRGLWILGRDSVRSNDKFAAQELVRTATAAVEILMRAQAQNRKLFTPILRNAHHWPVLVGLGREGSAHVQEQIAGLGEDLFQREGFNSAAFEKLEALPARKWAYAVKTVLEWNRILVLSASKNAKNWSAFKKYLKKQYKVEYVHLPGWFFKCGFLPEFSKASVQEWMAVGKEMIKDQMPEFDKLEEWKNWERRAAARTKPGNNPRAKKRNDIFDSIESAMETIARDDGLPEAASRNPVTDKL